MPLMLTWNMQGGQGNQESKWQTLNGVIGNPHDHNLDETPSIIFLQECSDVPNAVTPGGWVPIPGAPANVTRFSKNYGTHHNPKCYFIAHYDWGVGNNRVSFAVLIRTAANAGLGPQQWSDDLSAQVVVHPPVAGAAGTRPIIGVLVGTATYYSMHAPSGVATGFSRTYVSGMINAAAAGPNYVIGGDFNCDPDALYNAINPIPNGQLDTSGHATCGQEEYDYFTSNNSAINNTALNDITLVNLLSDHSGVVASI
ncbi:MAG: hypothetical protein ACN4GR_17445 [Arenicellales bacterium]